MQTFIQDNLKSLEARWGRRGSYVKQIYDSDPTVRKQGINETVYSVKVIVLPNTFERTQATMTGGGNYDIGTRWLIIRKLPIEPTIQDKIRVSSKEYTVISYETLDDDIGHLFKCTSKEEGIP